MIVHRISFCMKWLSLVLNVLCLSTAGAAFVWSEWTADSGCTRLCTEPRGAAVYRRDCWKCTKQGSCKIVSEQLCHGNTTKNDGCYVASSCHGNGPYIGEWSEWRRVGRCPPGGVPYRGVSVTYVRSCRLRGQALSQRSRMPFKCPGSQSAFCRRRQCWCEVGRRTDGPARSDCSAPCCRPCGSAWSHALARRQAVVYASTDAASPPTWLAPAVAVGFTVVIIGIASALLVRDSGHPDSVPPEGHPLLAGAGKTGQDRQGHGGCRPCCRLTETPPGGSSSNYTSRDQSYHQNSKQASGSGSP